MIAPVVALYLRLHDVPAVSPTSGMASISVVLEDEV